MLLLLDPLLSQAQRINSDSSAIEQHINLRQLKKHYSLQDSKPHFERSKNPLKISLYSLLFVYQRIISEQISAVCEFEPSCSGFGMDAIKKYGIIKGICLTADRLTRCNGQAQTDTEGFLLNHQTGKTIDAVTHYHFKD